MSARAAQHLEQVALALALGVIALTGLNFMVHHEIGGAASDRFIASGVMLSLVAAYFRLGIRPVQDLHRAAYRVALTMAAWSFTYAVLPYPQTILYLIALPAFFFAFRGERKISKHAAPEADLVAAGILYVVGALLYFEQGPLQAVLFEDAAFDWRGYYWNAPVLAAIGVGFVRLGRWLPWRGVALVGVVCTFVGVGMTLTAISTLATDASSSSFLFTPQGLATALVLGHVTLAWFHRDSFSQRAFQAFAGLGRAAGRRLATQMLAFQLALFHVAIAFICWTMDGAWYAAPLLLLAVCGWLHQARRGGLAIALLQTSALIFLAPVLLYPTLDSLIVASLLAGMLALAAILGRSVRFRHNITVLVYAPIALLALVVLYERGFFQPSTLAILFVLGASWSALSTLPSPHPLLGWPIALALVALCLNGGYDNSLWAPLSLAMIGIPALAVLIFTKLPLQYRSQLERSSTRLANTLNRLRTSLRWLTALTLPLAVAAAMLEQDGDSWAFAARMGALVICFIIHLRATLAGGSVVSALAAEGFLIAALAVTRHQLDMLEAIDRGSPIDGYVLIGLAFVAAGLREILKRRAQSIARLFAHSTTFYAVLGWLYMLWLNIQPGGGFHSEIGIMCMAALYWWMSRTQHRGHAIVSLGLVNVALLLFFVHLELDNLQFYVMPVAASVLLVAQMFHQQLNRQQHLWLRMACALAMLGTSSFYNVVDFDASYAVPLAAAVTAALGVVVGIALRVRVYLYLGFAAFAFNAMVVLVHVIQNQPPAQTKLIIGAIFLLIGIIFTGTFLAMQIKRQAILTRYQQMRDELATWE